MTIIPDMTRVLIWHWLVLKADLKLIKLSFHHNRVKLYIYIIKLQGKSVANLQGSLEAMKGTALSLKEERGTDLLSQLSVEDQEEMDKLNDQIKTLTQQNKDSLKERIKVRYSYSKISLERPLEIKTTLAIKTTFFCTKMHFSI